MAKQTLVNNGLPEGLHFKDIKTGDILLVMYKDVKPEHLIVIDPLDSDKPKTFKGYVSFKCIGAGRTQARSHEYIESDQVIAKVGTVNDQLLALDKKLTQANIKVRYPG